MKVAPASYSKKSTKPKKRILIAPIPLERPEKKSLSKQDYLTFKLRSNPAEADSTTYELTVPFFKSGTPEEVLDFVRDVNRVIQGQNITTGPAKYAIMRRLLKADMLAAFDSAATEAGNETNANFEVASRGLIEHVFPKKALQTQKRCMRRFMRKPADCTMRQFMGRLVEINGKLSEFPPFEDAQALPLDEILDIGEYATPNSWQREMIIQDFDPMANNVADLVDFCERMERTEEHDADAQTVKTGKMKSVNDKIPKRGEKRPNGMWCTFCEMNNHMTDDCRHLERMKRKRAQEGYNEKKKQRYSWSRKEQEKKKEPKEPYRLSKEQVHAMVARAVKRYNDENGVAGAKRKPEESFEVEEDEESFCTAQEELDNLDISSDSEVESDDE